MVKTEERPDPSGARCRCREPRPCRSPAWNLRATIYRKMRASTACASRHAGTQRNSCLCSRNRRLFHDLRTGLKVSGAHYPPGYCSCLNLSHLSPSSRARPGKRDGGSWEDGDAHHVTTLDGDHAHAGILAIAHVQPALAGARSNALRGELYAPFGTPRPYRPGRDRRRAGASAAGTRPAASARTGWMAPGTASRTLLFMISH